MGRDVRLHCQPEQIITTNTLAKEARGQKKHLQHMAEERQDSTRSKRQPDNLVVQHNFHDLREPLSLYCRPCTL